MIEPPVVSVTLDPVSPLNNWYCPGPVVGEPDVVLVVCNKAVAAEFD